MDVHLIDGTYELFRQFFGQKGQSRRSREGQEVGAVIGVVSSVLTMIDEGATHVAVATDHRIESFRNDMWAGYKTSAGVDAVLLAQFPVLEEALAAFGVLTLAMDELEADDGLASAAAVAADDRSVDRVLIWTPDKDLAQCVQGSRVIQVDRRNNAIVDDAGVRAKFGVAPESIPDWLALVGDSADGFPGLKGWGKQSAATVLEHYLHLEAIPPDIADWDDGLRQRVRSSSTLAGRLAEEMELALLFRDLATLRVDRSLVPSVDVMRWTGPTPEAGDLAAQLGSGRLSERASALSSRTEEADPPSSKVTKPE